MKNANQIQLGIKRYGITQYKIRLFGVNIWLSNHYLFGGWFMLFGNGIKWRHEILGLTFRERNKRVKYIKFHGWIFSLINVDKC